MSVNAVTRSQGQLLIEDVSEGPTIKAKGKQVVKDELAEQRVLAAKLIEEFAKMRPEQLESSSARQITKIAPKPLAEQKKASLPGMYKYVLKQEQDKMKVKPLVTKIENHPAREGKKEKQKAVSQEAGKSKNTPKSSPRTWRRRRFGSLKKLLPYMRGSNGNRSQVRRVSKQARILQRKYLIKEGS